MLHPRWSLVLLFGAGLMGLSAPGCGGGTPALTPPDPPTVTVDRPKVVSWRITKEFTGRLVTKDPVKVVPQVTGRLVARVRVVDHCDWFGELWAPDELPRQVPAGRGD